MRDTHGPALAAPVFVAALLATPLLVGVPAASRGQTSAASPRAGATQAGPELPAVARQVYEGTMSPFCPELLLANCPSPQADSLRRAVAARAAAGETRAHIVADLLATYGDVVRAAPERRGFGLVAWVVPGVLLATAAGWVTRWTRRSARVSLSPSPAISAASPALARGERAHDAPARDGPAHDGAPDGTATELAALDALLRRG